MNPFTPFGDASLMRMANLYANIAHLGAPADLDRVFDMIAGAAAKLLGAPAYGPRPGAPADLAIFDATSRAEAVAQIAPAMAGWKDGRPTFVRPAPQLLRMRKGAGLPSSS